MKRIPTYEDCLKIVESTGKKVFYETKHVVQNYNVSIFNYRLTCYDDFIKFDSDARENRGITFVFNTDGTLYKRYLMLRKFWNLNQVTETQYSLIKNKQIVSVYDKQDGSLISFIKLPNGNIIPRTKASFGHEMLVDVNEIYNADDKLKRFVEYCLDNDLAPFFEYVSWNNRIVLQYSEPKLILLRIRDNKNGLYKSIDEYDLEKAKKEKNYSLEEMISMAETLQDKEGWVVQFADGEMVKQKTRWYFDRHKLLTENLNHETYIISMILNETIDDAIAQLDEQRDKEKLEWIAGIIVKIRNYISEVSEIASTMLLDYDDKVEDKTIAIARFARKYKKEKYFGIAIHVVRGKPLYDAVKNSILNNTKRLEMARKFLAKI